MSSKAIPRRAGMTVMSIEAPTMSRPFSDLLRGEPAALRALADGGVRALAWQCGVIIAGAGLYGAAMGWWRAPLQGIFTAAKFPLIVLLVAAGNGLLNGMLAPLLGVNLALRQSCRAVLASFAIAAAILGAFSPIAAFLVWNAPAIGDAADSGRAYNFILPAHVAVIAFAGVAANVRLWGFLKEAGGTAAAANRVLFAWLAGNLFLGSQLTWIFRPFIGAPGLQVQFLRDHPLAGSFFEALFRSIVHLLNLD